MPIPASPCSPRRRLPWAAFASLLAASASAALPLGCGEDGVSCGAGTRLASGQCVPLAEGAAGAGAGALGGAGRAGNTGLAGGGSTAGGPNAGAGGSAGTGIAPPGLTQVRLNPVDGYVPGSYGGIVPVALGVPTTFVVVGSFPVGGSQRLSEGVTFTMDPDPDVKLTVQEGYATLRFAREGAFTLTGSVLTAAGPMLTSTKIQVSLPKDPALNIVIVPPGSWDVPHVREGYLDSILSAARTNGAVPGRAGAGSALRVVTALEYDLAIPANEAGAPDKIRHGTVLLDPEALAFEPSSGTVDSAARLTLDVPGEVSLGVRHILPGADSETLELSGTGIARFFVPSPVAGLALASSRVLVAEQQPYPRPIYTAPEGSLSLESFTDGTLGSPDSSLSNAPMLIELSPSNGVRSYPYSLTIAAAHGAGAETYFEELPWSEVSLEILAGAESLVEPPPGSPEGTRAGGKPGVAAFLAHAAGFELPGLAAVRYPSVDDLPSAKLRVSPSPLKMTLPSPKGPGVCATVSLFLTPPDAPERPITPLELLAAQRFPDDIAVIRDIPEGKRVTEFCLSPSNNNPGKGSFTLQLLGAGTKLGVEL